ncbi:MAG TPA: NAD(P)-dependent oxidoreductase [Rhodocyclaceae bacterium]|nr:NAD(P)-dependent oxidoreductase [Rhodocyclaceae bacterium]
MRVLCTGAAGFICSYLIPELLEAGHEVIGIDDRSRYGGSAHAYDAHPRYRFVAGDVRDTDLLRELALDCDQIVGGAGLVGRMHSLSELAYDLLAENERINASTFDAAIDACLDGHLERAIVLSSTMVYESAAVFPTPEGAERKSPPPISTYGFQKLASEYFALGAWEQYRLPYTIIRPSSPVGRGERRGLHGLGGEGDAKAQPGKLATNHAVPDLVIKILTGQDPLHLTGEGTQVRNYIAASDLARGIRLAMESPDAVNQDFNLGTSKGISVLELAERIWRKIHGPAREFRYVSDTPYRYDVPYRVPDIRKARAVLGFEAAVSLDAMLDDVIAWIREEIASGGLTPQTRA